MKIKKKWVTIGIGLVLTLVLVGIKQFKPDAVLPTPTSNENTYLVEKVVDGDTLQVRMGDKKETVRLIGVDTPETVDPRKTVQCFGFEAADETRRLVEGKMVVLENDLSQGDRDKYERLLRYVYLKDGVNVNLTLIANGFGHEYTYDGPYKYQTEFKAAEKTARERGLGLWGVGVCPVLGAQNTCGTKTKCNEMTSCEEAKFYLGRCGVKSLDSNGDGVPCEGLCK